MSEINSLAQVIFGLRGPMDRSKQWSKQQLGSKPSARSVQQVSHLFPHPLAGWYEQRLQNFMATGEGDFVGDCHYLLGLDRSNGCIFPMLLHVSEVLPMPGLGWNALHSPVFRSVRFEGT